MTVQARFYVKEINHRHTGSPDEVNVEVKLGAAFGAYLKGIEEGNEDWSKWTPSGDIAITITNPSAIEQFAIGGVYAVTFDRLDD